MFLDFFAFPSCTSTSPLAGACSSTTPLCGMASSSSAHRLRGDHRLQGVGLLCLTCLLEPASHNALSFTFATFSKGNAKQTAVGGGGKGHLLNIRRCTGVISPGFLKKIRWAEPCKSPCYKHDGSRANLERGAHTRSTRTRASQPSFGGLAQIDAVVLSRRVPEVPGRHGGAVGDTTCFFDDCGLLRRVDCL